MAASSTLSTITLHSSACISPSTTALVTPPSLSFSKQYVEFPLRTTKFAHRSTFLHSVVVVAMEEKVVQIGDEISHLTLSDAQKLVEYLKEKLIVTAASFAPAVVVVTGPGGTGKGAAEVVEEKTEFDVVIDDVQSNAGIATIKAKQYMFTETLFPLVFKSRYTQYRTTKMK